MYDLEIPLGPHEDGHAADVDQDRLGQPPQENPVLLVHRLVEPGT